jgi:hypothetical protein
MSTTPRQPDVVTAQVMPAAAAEAPTAPITGEEAAVLERLMVHGRRDSGSYGAFDLTSLWSLGVGIVADMTILFGLIGRIHRHPDSLGYEAEFKAIVQGWRPELGD